MNGNRPRPAGWRRDQPIRSGWRRLKSPCLWIAGLLVIAVAARVALSLVLLGGTDFEFPTSFTTDLQRPPTHYEVLNITIDGAATDEQLQSAYRRQLKNMHPDKVRGGGNETAVDDLERLQKARDVLKPNTQRRCFYDYMTMRAMNSAQYLKCSERAQKQADKERHERWEQRLAEERAERQRMQEAEEARRNNPPQFGDVHAYTPIDFLAEAKARARAWVAEHAERAAKALGDRAPKLTGFVVRNKWAVSLGSLGSATFLTVVWLFGL